MSSSRNNTSSVKFETRSHVVKEENQGLVLLLGFFLISATLFGLPSDESNFTVDEFGKRHYVLVAENTNTSFLVKLNAIVSGRYSLEHQIFDYADLTIDSESILLLLFVFSSLLYFELGRGNSKFVPLGIIMFRFANSKPTTLIFLLLSDFFKNITREHSKNKILLLSIFAVLILATPQFYQDAYGASPTVDDNQSAQTEGGTTCAVTLNVGASSDLIVIGVNSDGAISSVADEDGQTYIQRVAETTSHFSYLYTTTSPVTNAANTVTVTISGASDTTCFGVVLSGVDTTSPIGNIGSNSGITGTSDTITYSTGTDQSNIIHVCGSEAGSSETFDAGKTVLDRKSVV